MQSSWQFYGHCIMGTCIHQHTFQAKRNLMEPPEVTEISCLSGRAEHFMYCASPAVTSLLGMRLSSSRSIPVKLIHHQGYKAALSVRVFQTMGRICCIDEIMCFG